MKLQGVLPVVHRPYHNDFTPDWATSRLVNKSNQRTHFSRGLIESASPARTYRMASWWIRWNDVIYPDHGVAAENRRRARACRVAGIDACVIFGAHFRWDFLYLWDRLHLLLRDVAAVLHDEGLLLFDHHSANLVHRPRDEDGQWNIANKNRHHVPFYPSAELAGELTWRGQRLADWRMCDVRDGRPCFLPKYDAEIFCMNHPGYRRAYLDYLRHLRSETGIDGLMCDDVIYYPGWQGCGCAWCRRKFKQRFGHRLPPATDASFWGNFDHPSFRDWTRMRFHDSGDFLAAVRGTLGESFPLMSCCAFSTARFLGSTGLSARTLARGTNHLMLEMCGEITHRNSDITVRVPDLLLHTAIAAPARMPNIGLGYAYYSDTAFLGWAFNKLMGNSTWISTLKGRLGIPERDLARLPDEEEIVGEGFRYEATHPRLFRGRTLNRIAIYHSFADQMFHGRGENDGMAQYAHAVRALFNHNLQFDVLPEFRGLRRYAALVLCDVHCLSAADRASLCAWMRAGGTLLAAGPLGFRDEQGRPSKSFLAEFGIEVSWQEPASRVRPALLFKDNGSWAAARPVADHVRARQDGRKLPPRAWVVCGLGRGALHWLPARCLGAEIAGRVAGRVAGLVAGPVRLELTSTWHWRLYHHGRTLLVQALNGVRSVKTDPRFTNQMSREGVVRSLRWAAGGELAVRGNFRHAVLHSPDLVRPRTLAVRDGRCRCALGTVRRFFTLELK